VSLAIRQIPYEIMEMKDLGLPPVVETLAEKHQGLILVTGPTGCGKSTTLASVIDKVNRERTCHIITIEDPIEYIHQHKKCIVNQREVKADTVDFKTALKHVLRQDPDVILIGEMRDLETMQAALTIAETGHLTLATLHTNSTYESINRIVDSFPAGQQGQVRAQLAFVLEGVVTQQLIPRANGRGRVLVCEVMMCTPAIRATIRDDKVHQIYGLMQAGQKFGMQTMNQGLFSACIKGDITKEEGMRRSSDADELARMLGEKAPAW
jgi:twitching motility protein PilT